MKTLKELYSGRMNRRNFFYWFVALKLLDLLIYKPPYNDITILLFAVFLVQVVTGSIIATKRLHDFGFSGWYSILFLIPVIGFFVGLGLLITKGDSKANTFGEAPK